MGTKIRQKIKHLCDKAFNSLVHLSHKHELYENNKDSVH